MSSQLGHPPRTSWAPRTPERMGGTLAQLGRKWREVEEGVEIVEAEQDQHRRGAAGQGEGFQRSEGPMLSFLFFLMHF